MIEPSPLSLRARLLGWERQVVMAYAALALSVLVLSLSGLFVRWAGAPGPVTSFFRMGIASVVLTAIVVQRGAKVRPTRWKLMLLPLAGGLFTALDHSTWSTAIEYTNIANATLLNNIAPLWVALVAVLFWRERLRGLFWLGLGLALLGAAIVFSIDLTHDPHGGRGDLLAIISSVFYAGYFLVTQRGRRHFDVIPYVWLTTLVAALFLLVLNLAVGNQLLGLSSYTYLMFLAVALISQITGYFSLSYALGHLPASVVAPTMISQPVLTALLAIPLAGELLSMSQWIGGAAVLAGIYLVNRVRG
ncbi:MAG TPA: DMT family transporter, partial [Levilinea sp.]|nr:DMT family transporter [Levilinea sp.]